MRTFIAIDMPADVLDVFEDVQSRLKGGQLGMAGEFHCTLKFLGDITDEQLAVVKKELSAIKNPQLQLMLDAVGAFPNWKEPKVLWAGLEPAKDVVALQQKVDVALADLFPPSEKFIPHVTLARVKKVEDPRALLRAKTLPLPKQAFLIEKFTLYKSTLSPGGPTYEELLSVPLQPVD